MLPERRRTAAARRRPPPPCSVRQPTASWPITARSHAPRVAHSRPFIAQQFALGRWPLLALRRAIMREAATGDRPPCARPSREAAARNWPPCAAGAHVIARACTHGIQLAAGPQPLRLRNHNFGLAQWIMVKRLATSRHDPLGITDSAYKNQLVVISVQYGPFNTYIPIRSTTIGKSRVARDPIAMHTSWRSNSDITSVTRVSMTFRVVRTNQYNQDLGLINSTNGNHLESPNEGSSIDHQLFVLHSLVQAVLSTKLLSESALS
ncbi:hypothetical protein F511_19244 [Dorcoceras hygrometricum]|uniref:Uncharacterized protein n=1 Tax=Dorcoceras hygrometricum TaxID=472368 RepID=A0A2Z7CVJ2_9LAMI|nr:hypothetical protein F511_19244 [Dorcoceras hygrometricum]